MCFTCYFYFTDIWLRRVQNVIKKSLKRQWFPLLMTNFITKIVTHHQKLLRNCYNRPNYCVILYKHEFSASIWENIQARFTLKEIQLFYEFENRKFYSISEVIKIIWLQNFVKHDTFLCEKYYINYRKITAKIINIDWIWNIQKSIFEFQLIKCFHWKILKKLISKLTWIFPYALIENSC